MTVRNTKDGSKKPWLAEVYPEGREGPRKRKKFATKGEALNWENWLISNADSKPWEEKEVDSRRLSDLVDIWFRQHGQTLNDGVRRKAKLIWLCEALGNPIATEFTGQTFAAYREKRLSGEIYIPGQRKNVTPTTINRELLYLQAVFNELGRLGEWSGGNPLAVIRQYKVQETELAYLTEDEIQLVLDECKYNRDLWLIVMLCLSTGARWSEIEQLTRSRVGKGRITFTKTKGKRNRTVPVADWLLAMLPNRAGRLFSDCYDEFEKVIARTNIKLPSGPLTHVLRHSFASHFMMGGGNILVLQRILGHTDIKTTMRYAHFAPDHLEDAVRLNPITQMKNGDKMAAAVIPLTP